MSTATVHGGRHTRQALKAHRQPAKAPRGRLRALRSFFWAPAPRGSKQTASSSLLGAPVDVAEEAQEQQRGGEPGPVEPNERLADTGEQKAATEAAAPEFAGAADRGQMAEPWTSPWGRADIRGLLDARDKDAAAKAAAEGEDAAGPDTEDEPKPTFTAAPADDSQPWYGITEMEMPPVHDRPYVPQAPEVAAASEIPPAYLRALEPGKGFFRQHGLSACPLFLEVRDVAGVATAAVKLGSDDDGDWHIIDATVPEWLDDAIAALTQARSALADAIAAAGDPAEDDASVLAEVVEPSPAEAATEAVTEDEPVEAGEAA